MQVDVPKTRYPLATSVEILAPTLSISLGAELQNISLSGCYVRTSHSVPEHTRVRIILQTRGIKADLWGVVQRQDAGGIGIQFTNGTTVEDWKALESVIHQLASEIFPKSQATHAGI